MSDLHVNGLKAGLLKAEELNDACFILNTCLVSAPDTADIARDYLNNPCARYVGVRRGGRLIGAAGCVLIMEEAHITLFAVTEGERRNGAGTLLLQTLLQLASDSGACYAELECRRTNNAAQGLYKKLGFIRVGVRKGYYTDTNEDALIYALPVLPKPNPMDDPHIITGL